MQNPYKNTDTGTPNTDTFYAVKLNVHKTFRRRPGCLYSIYILYPGGMSCRTPKIIEIMGK